MEQITQKLKEGKISITEVPVPVAAPGEILVRNAYSCISAGTESSTVSAARKGYLGKLKDRPEQARQVLDTLITQGPLHTYRAVMKKLDAHSPLGYSCVGQVIGVGADVRGFSVGDYAACGGNSASHAEVVSVPENLSASVHPDVDLQQAAYNTLGAIALHGVRQASLRLGETCAVIGLGLLGHLTCALLRAAGQRVVGIDVNPVAVKIAAERCLDLALVRGESGTADRVLAFTQGLGCDAVIITAATDSLDPINFAGVIARKRASVVVVGAVPTGFDREPHFYKKELSVKMSCSYGPGRYDANYEEKGLDYPPAYVRWTEQRNMQVFQDMIRSRKLDLTHLTTHVVQLADAAGAYDMILGKSEPFLGVLVKYDSAKQISTQRIQLRDSSSPRQKSSKISIGFIGAGNYAQGYLLPNLGKAEDVVLKGVLTATPTGARSVADRFGFEFCTTQAEDILISEEINTVFIASRHDSHGPYVLQALRAGKNVFVEKPLCLRQDELDEIASIVRHNAGNGSPRILMVGYNRRFSPLSSRIKAALHKEPMALLYRINAGAIPADSWIQDPQVGGGRILGEVCHFVDYLTFLNEALPVSVFATGLLQGNCQSDTLSVTLTYENGSIGTVHYFANGSKKLAKEYVEIYQSGLTAVLDDYRSATIFSRGRRTRQKLWVQDKGQKHEVACFLDAIRKGNLPVIPFEQIESTSRVCFRVLDSLQTRKVLPLT